MERMCFLVLNNRTWKLALFHLIQLELYGKFLIFVELIAIRQLINISKLVLFEILHKVCSGLLHEELPKASKGMGLPKRHRSAGMAWIYPSNRSNSFKKESGISFLSLNVLRIESSCQLGA